jgi:DNA-binding NarL/FixJ family response regulator
VITRREALRLGLDALIDGDPGAVVGQFDAAGAATGDSVFLALSAWARYVALDFAGALTAAERALDAAPTELSADPVAVLLAWTVRGMVSAGRRTAAAGEPDSWTATAPGRTPSGDPLADVLERLDALDGITATESADHPDLVHFVRYLAGDAAVACGRFALASAIVDRSGPLPELFVDERGNAHPVVDLIAVMRARCLLFSGHAGDAAAVLASRRGIRRPAIVGLLLASTETLVRGATGERAEVRALADRLELARPNPADYISVGCYTLAAWGLFAVGDVRRSARIALFAGGRSLELLSIVSRGLTLELLVSAALDENDVDAAEAWRERAEPLHAEPIANTSAARVHARVELSAGRGQSALLWAERAEALAVAEGRVFEASQARQLALRAKGMLAGAPDRPLAATGSAAGSIGPGLVASGRRVPPVAGSDWDGLSDRERDIALMVADGLTNREIGQALFLSEHTVRAHVSRVLAAFGAASRFAVAARVAELFPAADGTEEPVRAALTPRQAAVAERVAFGFGNAEISRELGLSVKTVEKHIGEIFRRWKVTSRVGVARIVRAGSGGARRDD